MSNQISINVFDHIDSICRSFRKQWKDGAQPRIEQFFNGVDPPAQATLFRNLLHLEIEFRRRNGEQPTAQEYIQRFSNFDSAIRQAFLVSTMASLAGGDTDKLTQSFDAPAVSQLGQYQLIRELGRGGFGIVYEARHIHRNELVALKTLRSGIGGQSQSLGDADRLHKFRQEFRSLCDVSHPNLVGMQSLEVDGDQWFLTMDLVDGVDFISYVRPGDQLDEDRLRAALPQLVSGIIALHAQHIVHRDVKPSNVMVTAQGRIGVLDFGLVAETRQTALGSTTDLSRDFAGTPAYAAPEQISGRRSAATDWYAVGIMLYEALAGELPYQGTTIEVLTKKEREDPPTLIGLEGIPADLARLAMRLLARKPEERPSSLEIAGMISANLPISTSGKSGEQILVGRDTHLQSMRQAYEAFVSGRIAVTLFVEGRSGEGKTTLVENFLDWLGRSSEKVVVLQGRCYDRESVPLKALDSLIDPLCTWLRSHPDQAVACLPEDIHMLAHLFPVMRRVEVVAGVAKKVGRLDMKQVRQRAFLALREMLRRVSQRSGVLLFIDDLQWGDADSAEAVFELLKPPDPPAVMLLGTYRSDEAGEAPFLQSLRKRRGGDVADHLVTLGPLSLEECVELVVARRGEDSASIRERAVAIFEATGGNPYFLDQLIEYLDADSNTFHAVPLQEIIDRKLKQLPESASRLLELVALSGHAVSLPEISQASGDEESVVSTLTHMRTERLVRLIDSSDQQLVDTYHDKIREAVLSQMELGHQKQLHLALAKVIEAQEGVSPDFVEALQAADVDLDAQQVSSRVYDLAHHYDAAGRQQEAWMYALLAAEQAKQSFALDVAAEYYKIASRNAGNASNAVRFEIGQGLGQTLMLGGRYKEAKEIFDGVLPLTDDPVKQARIESFHGDLAYKQGAVKSSVSYHEDALSRLGCKVPRSKLGTAVALVRESLIQVFHTVSRKKWYQAHEPGDRALHLTIETLDRLSMSNWFVFTPKMLWAHLAAMNLAETVLPSRQLVFSYGLHAAPVSVLGMFSRGVDYGERAIVLSRELNDLWGQGHTYNFRGFGLLGGARYEESLRDLDMAIDLLGKTGDFWELNLAKYNTAVVHYRRGEFAKGIEATSALFQEVIRLGDDGAAHWVVDIWSKLTLGNLPFDELRTCFHLLPDNLMVTCMLMQAEGIWHLFHGRPKESMDVLDEAWHIAKSNFVLNMYTVPAMVWLASALRINAESQNPKDRSRLQRRAFKLARWSYRLGRFFPQDRPHALREIGLLLEAQGRLKQALVYAERSRDVATVQGAKYELAQSALVCAKVREKMGVEGANAQIEEAYVELARFQSTISDMATGMAAWPEPFSQPRDTK